MIYASTRNSVTKSLGATNFVDTIFATSKKDLTPVGYTAHKRHLAAPKPMSAREKEMADIKAAEREVGSAQYNSSAVRKSPFGTGVGLRWSSEVEAAVRDLADATEDHLVTMTIDPSTETLTLGETTATPVDELKNKIPSSDPSFAFFSWSETASERCASFSFIPVQRDRQLNTACCIHLAHRPFFRRQSLFFRHSCWHRARWRRRILKSWMRHFYVQSLGRAKSQVGLARRIMQGYLE